MILHKSIPLISIVIATCNRHEKLHATLEHFNRQSIPSGSFEIIVCDDGSSDDTGQLVQDFNSNFSLLYLKQPKSGAAKARNMAVPHIRGQYTLFLNDDMYPAPDLLASHLKAHKLHKNPSAVVLGHIQFAPQHANSFISRALEQYDLLFPFNHSLENIPYDFDHFITGNLSISSDAFLIQENRFDENFPYCYCEDIEFGYRLWMQGYVIYYCKAATVYHDHKLTIDDDLRREELNTKNLLLFLNKHPELTSRYLGVQNIIDIKQDELQKKLALSEPYFGKVLEQLRQRQDISLDDLISYDSVKIFADSLRMLRSYVKHKTLVGQLKAHPSKPFPLVSVIIPCFNYAHYLSEALQSVIFQTYQNFEIIIVNDGSSDNTVEVAHRLISTFPQHSISLIDQENSGHPARSRNVGISRSRGEYILPLDADDTLHPRFLEIMVQALEELPANSIVYCDTVRFGDHNDAFSNPDWDPDVLRFSNYLNYCSLYPKSLWELLGGYKPCGFEDWEFWLNAVENGCQAKRVPLCLFNYRTKKGGRLEEELQPRDAEYKAQLVILHPSLYDKKQLDWAWGIIRSLKR